jgi:hypothetical protein
MLVLFHALPIPRGLRPLGMTYCGGLAKSVPMECHSEAASAAEESVTASTNHACSFPRVTDSSGSATPRNDILRRIGKSPFPWNVIPRLLQRPRNRGLLPPIMLVRFHALPIPRGLRPLGMTYCGGLAKSVPMECHSEAASAAEESVTVSTNHACSFPRVTDPSLRFAQGRRGLPPLGMTYCSGV